MAGQEDKGRTLGFTGKGTEEAESPLPGREDAGLNAVEDRVSII
jgi:hypothetical protein